MILLSLFLQVTNVVFSFGCGALVVMVAVSYVGPWVMREIDFITYDGS